MNSLGFRLNSATPNKDVLLHKPYATSLYSPSSLSFLPQSLPPLTQCYRDRIHRPISQIWAWLANKISAFWITFSSLFLAPAVPLNSVKSSGITSPIAASESSSESKAARTVQRAFRHHKLRQSKIDISTPLYFVIRTIEKTSDNDFFAGKCDAMIDNCLARIQIMQDRNGLKLLAHALFNGKTRGGGLLMGYPEVLQAVIYDPQTSMEVAANTMRKAIQYRRDLNKKYQVVEANQKFELETNGAADQRSWVLKFNKFSKSEGRQIKDDTLIQISHGGGLMFLKRFLTGEILGYSADLEYQGLGIFVSPCLENGFRFKEAGHDRDSLYAKRRTTMYYDIPAAFTAEIEARHLGAVPNLYEAHLHPSKVKYLKNISIRLIPHKINLERLYSNVNLNQVHASLDKVPDSSDISLILSIKEQGKIAIKEVAV